MRLRHGGHYKDLDFSSKWCKIQGAMGILMEGGIEMFGIHSGHLSEDPECAVEHQRVGSRSKIQAGDANVLSIRIY